MSEKPNLKTVAKPYRRVRLPKEIREAAYENVASQLREAYARVVAFWISILDDEEETIQNRLAAADRLAAYGVGTPAKREPTAEGDADAVRAITEARKALQGAPDSKPLLPPVPADRAS